MEHLPGSPACAAERGAGRARSAPSRSAPATHPRAPRCPSPAERGRRPSSGCTHRAGLRSSGAAAPRARRPHRRTHGRTDGRAASSPRSGEICHPPARILHFLAAGQPLLLQPAPGWLLPAQTRAGRAGPGRAERGAASAFPGCCLIPPAPALFPGPCPPRRAQEV